MAQGGKCSCVGADGCHTQINNYNASFVNDSREADAARWYIRFARPAHAIRFDGLASSMTVHWGPNIGDKRTVDFHPYARKIVGWRISTSSHAGFVLDALEQAVHDRRPVKAMGLVHHNDRSSQYLSIKYTERLADAGIEPSVGSVGASYDSALAETINCLFKAEIIHRRGRWRSFKALEYATLEWVDWFNNCRLLEPIGNIPAAEAEANFYAPLEAEAMAA